MNQRTAFVPIETWAYHAPKLRAKGKTIDIGLLAEALVYYDKIYLCPGNADHFAELVQWFKRQGHLGTFVSMIAEGSVVLYHYAFLSSPIHDPSSNVWSIWNVQDEESAVNPVFMDRIVRSARMQNLHPRYLRSQLESVLVDNHIEVKSEEFGRAIENARTDYAEPEQSAALVQVFLDEVYRDLGYIRPPEVRAEITKPGDGRQFITWNVDFARITELLGKHVGFHGGSPLSGATHSNRTLWSAAKLGADLYTSPPMTSLIRYKLEEGSRTTRRHDIITDLVARVAFPDVRALINEGKLSFTDVMALRKAATRFRRWLESESTYERDALVAYHQEVAAAAGFPSTVSKVLTISGVIGGTAIGAAIGGPIGGVKGAAVGKAVEYIADLGLKLTTGWKPVMYGQWAEARVNAAMTDSDKAGR